MWKTLTALVVIVLVCAVPAHAATFTNPAHASHGASLFTMIGVGLMLGAVLSTNALTILDWAKRRDPDGKTPMIAELLSQQNQILLDMLWREGNLPMGHQVTVRTGLPQVFWRIANAGINPSKSTTAQITEAIGTLEGWSEVDPDIANLNGDIGAFRASEARAFIEAMNQEFASTLFYGNQGLAPEEFTGLSVRYSDLSAANGDNIIDAGGATSGPPTDLTSAWLIGWGQETVFGAFPSGSNAGLEHNDYGEQTIEVTAGMAQARMRALQERFRMKGGLVVKDWRYAVRIANIDVSDLIAGTGSNPDLIELFEHACELIPSELGRPAFYVNRTIGRFLRTQARKQVGAGGGLTYDNYQGRRVLMFGEYPIRRVDALLNTEDEVS